MLTDITFIEYPWMLGAHMPLENTLFQTLKNGHDSGMKSIQFFLGNYLSYNKKKFTDTDHKKSLDFINRYPMNIFIHSSYIYNLCGTKDCLAWNGGDDEKILKAIAGIEQELRCIANFKVNGVVIHPGCYKNRQLGLETIAKSINKINFPEGSKLLLENCACEGDKLCGDFKEIKTVYDLVDRDKQKHIGVCIDTAHIWGAGLYDLTKIKQVEKMFNDFDNIIGLDKFNLLHLNDSKVDIKSRKDRHELIGEGKIWKDDISSLIVLLNLCDKYNIPIILETHHSDMNTIYHLWKTISDSD